MKKIDKEEYISDLLNVYLTYGKLTSSLYKKHGKYSPDMAYKFFGSFDKAKEFLGISTKRPELPFTLSKEEVIKDVTKIFIETNNTTRENYLKHGKYSRAPINRLFGNWNKMLEELGYDINMYKSKFLTKEEVLNDMRNIYNKHGYLTAELQRKESKFSQPIIDSIFGSFSNMIVELGIREPFSSYYSNDDILYNIKLIYYHYGTINSELLDSECIVRYATLINRFNNLENIAKLLNIKLCINSYLSENVIKIINKKLNSIPIKEKTFKWLKNPITNYHLKIDAYYKEFNLCVEIHGQQHYDFIPFFHKNMDNFLYYQYKDNIKRQLILDHNLKLLEIKYSDSEEEIISKLLNIING